LLHNSQVVDNKNEFLRHFYNNFRLSQGQLKTCATTPLLSQAGKGGQTEHFNKTNTVVHITAKYSILCKSLLTGGIYVFS
jgi:hypothetical protein